MQHGYSIPGVVTGKPVAIGGSLGRDKATARGCSYVVDEAMAEIGRETEGAKVAIQGFGNAGMYAAQLMSDVGYSIVAVSDSRGGVANDRGLDVKGLMAYKAETGSVAGFSGGDQVDNKAVLEFDCDVLVPAALEKVITAENAPRIRAQIVAEAANGPTTPDADTILFERRRHGASRHLGQCRRRDGLVLRVGARPSGQLLGRGRDQRTPEAKDGARLP